MAGTKSVKLQINIFVLFSRLIIYNVIFDIEDKSFETALW